MTTLEADIILALADNDMRIETTARAMYMHRTTLTKYVRKIKKDTGLDPLRFYDLEWLVARAKLVLGKYGSFYKRGASND